MMHATSESQKISTAQYTYVQLSPVKALGRTVVVVFQLIVELESLVRSRDARPGPMAKDERWARACAMSWLRRARGISEGPW
jgi:hypothetical protein